MKYGIVGATGLTGMEILKQLPSHEVSVFVRQPDKLPKEMTLEVVQGEVSDHDALTAWASKQETVFVALGHPMSWNLVRYNIGLTRDYPIKGILTKSLLAVMKGKPKRLIYLSAYGTHETRSDMPFVVRKIFLPIFIAETYRDHEEAETLMRSYSEEWVVVCPAQLTNDAARERYRAEVRINPWGAGKISRADVAHFMIRSAKDTSWIGKKVGLSY